MCCFVLFRRKIAGGYTAPSARFFPVLPHWLSDWLPLFAEGAEPVARDSGEKALCLAAYASRQRLRARRNVGISYSNSLSQDEVSWGGRASFEPARSAFS